MYRTVNAGGVIYDQITIYDPIGTFNRLTGATLTDFSLNAFFNNTPLAWVIADGVGVLDSEVSPGVIYFNEIASAPGFYSVRFYPNAVGYWSISLLYTPTTYENVLNYDVKPAQQYPGPNAGLIASFF